MYSMIYFDSDMREDEFTVIVPTEIKDKLIYVFKVLGTYKNYTPKLVINNVEYRDVEVNNLHEDTLGEQINYLTMGLDEEDFLEELSTLKEYLVEIANVCVLDYIQWEYENLLKGV